MDYQAGWFLYYTHTQGNRIALWKTSRISDLKNAPVQTVWTHLPAVKCSEYMGTGTTFLNNKWYLYYTAGSSTDLATQRTFVLETPVKIQEQAPGTIKEKLVIPLRIFLLLMARYLLTTIRIIYLEWTSIPLTVHSGCTYRYGNPGL